MTDLFSYTKKIHDDGTKTTSFKIHPFLSFVLIAIVVGFSFVTCVLITN